MRPILVRLLIISLGVLLAVAQDNVAIKKGCSSPSSMPGKMLIADAQAAMSFEQFEDIGVLDLDNLALDYQPSSPKAELEALAIVITHGSKQVLARKFPVDPSAKPAGSGIYGFTPGQVKELGRYFAPGYSWRISPMELHGSRHPGVVIRPGPCKLPGKAG